MSVLIKDMEMPINCIYEENGKTKFCFFCNHDDTPFCAYRGTGLGLDDERPDWCTLVEVPTPHGRLIDEDNVIDAIHERLQTLRTHKEFIKKHGDIDLLGVMPYIAKIPTVIEAEECDDE